MRRTWPVGMAVGLAGCPGGSSSDGDFGAVSGASFTATSVGTDTGGTTGAPQVPTDNLLGELLLAETWSEVFLYRGEWGNPCSDCREVMDMQAGAWSGPLELRMRMWYADAGSSGQQDGDQVCLEGYRVTAVSTVPGYDPYQRVLVDSSPAGEDCMGPALAPRIVLQRVDTDPTGWPDLIARWPTTGDGTEHWPGWATSSPLMGAVPLQACDPPTFSHCAPPCELGTCDLPPPPDPPGMGTGTGSDTGTSTSTSG